jgi:hypothetical protein
VSSDEHDAAEALLGKVRTFVAGLTPTERRLFAALLAPGVAKAQEERPEVEGFDFPGWSPQALPEGLVRAIREADVRVEGL